VSLILTAVDLREVTRRTHSDAQQRVLRALGVPYRLDGRRIIVSKAAFEAALSDRALAPEAANEAYSVDFGALRRLAGGKKAQAL
jgi:hypothetical protein